jgi:hypothetical protein
MDFSLPLYLSANMNSAAGVISESMISRSCDQRRERDIYNLPQMKIIVMNGPVTTQNLQRKFSRRSTK